MPLDVRTDPFLLVGGGSSVQGEIWLQNTTGSDVKIESARLFVEISPGTQQDGAIPLPPDATVPADGIKRVEVGFGMEPFTPAGTYPAHVDLVTSIGNQTVDATLVVLANTQVVAIAEQSVFTGVASPSTLTTSVLVNNAGNVAVTLGAIPDERLFRVDAAPRVLGVEPSGATTVQPATSLSPLTEEVTFTPASSPTIAAAGWARVEVDIDVPAGLDPDQHLRCIPRILNDRISIDLLT